MDTSKFWNKPSSELDALGTRHLLALHKASRIRPYSCSCGSGYHCGDDALPLEEQQANQAQYSLHKQLKELLAKREHVIQAGAERRLRQLQSSKREKKRMKY